MKRKLKHIKEFFTSDSESQDSMFEMANFGTKTTGLPMIVWVSEKRASHGPRIKVSRSYNHKVLIGDTFSVSISDTPEIVAGDTGDIKSIDVRKVYDWVVLNKETLLEYWNSDILTDELISKIKNI
jgi:hypothetical protein